MADLFFDVYEMAVDTTFICFRKCKPLWWIWFFFRQFPKHSQFSVEDSEQNDGSLERPFFMSEKLLEILGNKNDIPLHSKWSQPETPIPVHISFKSQILMCND